MSRSNPQIKNPANRFMQWRGAAEAFKNDKGKTEYEGGRLSYYDKEQEEEIDVALPFSFLVLDELHTITGFSESDQSGFWSNEVKDLGSELLTVKTKRGTIARGKYADIKDTIKAKGAKYTKSVYIAYKDETTGELTIGHLKFAGAALTAWIEFQKKYDVMQCAVEITDTPALGKKGTNHYFTPVFDGKEVSDATNKAATALDEELQRYLNTYFSRPVAADDAVEEEAEDIGDDGPVNNEPSDGDEPAVETEEPKARETESKAPAKGGEDKINLKDAPF